jgi:hypothetical protein
MGRAVYSLSPMAIAAGTRLGVYDTDHGGSELARGRSGEIVPVTHFQHVSRSESPGRASSETRPTHPASSLREESASPVRREAPRLSPRAVRVLLGPPFSCFVALSEQIEWPSVGRTDTSTIEGAVRVDNGVCLNPSTRGGSVVRPEIAEETIGIGREKTALVRRRREFVEHTAAIGGEEVNAHVRPQRPPQPRRHV